MRTRAGQAARYGGQLLHALVQMALALVMLAAIALAALSWRLSTGPLELPWLARRLEAAANAGSQTHLAIGSAALAWEGFRAGTDQPLDIRVTGVSATNAAGLRLAAIPRAEIALSPGRLVFGELVPRAIMVEGARLRVIRAADGSVKMDLGSLTDAIDRAPGDAGNTGLSTDVLRELSRPPAGDAAVGRGSAWSQLQRLHIRDSAISVADHQLGVTWRVPDLDLDAHRLPEGGLEADADVTLAVADQTARLSMRARLPRGSDRIALAATMSAVTPARLAKVIPALAALDAPVTLSGTLQLDTSLHPWAVSARAEIGAGTVHAGTGQAPLLGAVITADGAADTLRARLLHLDMAPRPDGPRTRLRGQVDLSRDNGGAMQAAIVLDLDRVAFADLSALWPEGTGGNGTRPWITGNVTDGAAHDGHFEIGLSLPADFSDATLTRVAGGISGEGVTVHWLRPVPPIEHVDAKLTLLTPDTLAIDVSGGRQAGGAQGGIQVQNGRLVISGLSANDQFVDIESNLTAPVVDVLTLLRNPRIKLLDRSPLQLRDAAGQIAGKLTVTRLPLRDTVTMDDVQIRTTAKLTDLRAAGIAAGRDLEHGMLTLEANPAGLRVSGSADVASVPARLQLDMDFRGGPPTQVTQRITADATIDHRQLAGLGLDTGGTMTGPAAMTATLVLQRNGHGEASVRADLTKAVLTADALSFTKPAGVPATLEARIVLDGDTLSAVDDVHLDGEGLHLDGDVAFAGGKPDVLHLRRLVLGGNVDAQGELQLPRTQGAPYVMSLSGRSMDASAALARGPAVPAKPAPPPPGPAYVIDAKFDRVVLGHGRQVESVALHLANDGHITGQARMTGQTGEKAPFQIAIAPQGKGRALTGSAADAGALLRALDVISTMQGGKLTLTGTYDDGRADHLLNGKAEIDDFRIRHAPVLARLLQALTLYGLVELAQGPGLGFTRLEAPFRYADDQLDLIDARAFSASLGMTAKGRIDLAHQTADLQGTIVPAYFFNSLLGNIPLLGRLFSPERGGGLFAATYTVRGKLDDPSVGVNPLAALTPGVLRQVFGIFETPPPAPR